MAASAPSRPRSKASRKRRWARFHRSNPARLVPRSSAMRFIQAEKAKPESLIDVGRLISAGPADCFSVPCRKRFLQYLPSRSVSMRACDASATLISTPVGRQQPASPQGETSAARPTPARCGALARMCLGIRDHTRFENEPRSRADPARLASLRQSCERRLNSDPLWVVVAD